MWLPAACSFAGTSSQNGNLPTANRVPNFGTSADFISMKYGSAAYSNALIYIPTSDGACLAKVFLVEH
jgi:hypothetical protein